jgi:hypothetical protein
MRMWNEVVVVLFWHLPKRLKDLTENHILSCQDTQTRACIWTRNLPSTNHNCYQLNRVWHPVCFSVLKNQNWVILLLDTTNFSASHSDAELFDPGSQSTLTTTNLSTRFWPTHVSTITFRDTKNQRNHHILALSEMGLWDPSTPSNWYAKILIPFLTLQTPGPTICTARFNIHKFYVLPTQCIYVFCMNLRTNSNYSPIQH